MGMCGQASGRGTVTEYPFPGSIGIRHRRIRASLGVHAPVATTNESAIFTGVLPAHYAAGGLTVRIGYSMSSAESGSKVTAFVPAT